MAFKRYRGDPYWTRAKQDGASPDGTQFRKGDTVFFYPRSGTTYAGDGAKAASSEFEMLAEMEAA
jgi:hypothetical protein